jgi:hypothetical protein
MSGERKDAVNCVFGLDWKVQMVGWECSVLGLEISSWRSLEGDVWWLVRGWRVERVVLMFCLMDWSSMDPHSRFIAITPAQHLLYKFSLSSFLLHFPV